MDLDEIDLQLDIHFIIKSLLEEGLISKADLESVDLYFSGFSFNEISGLLNRDWRVIQTSIRNFIFLVRQRCNNDANLSTML